MRRLDESGGGAGAQLDSVRRACDGPGAGADDNWAIGVLDTTYDPCIAELASPVGVMFTAIWSSGTPVLGFFEGGWSYFCAFGGLCFVVRPIACGEVSLLLTD